MSTVRVYLSQRPEPSATGFQVPLSEDAHGLYYEEHPTNPAMFRLPTTIPEHLVTRVTVHGQVCPELLVSGLRDYMANPLLFGVKVFGRTQVCGSERVSPGSGYGQFRLELDGPTVDDVIAAFVRVHQEGLNHPPKTYTGLEPETRINRVSDAIRRVGRSLGF